MIATGTGGAALSVAPLSRTTLAGAGSATGHDAAMRAAERAIDRLASPPGLVLGFAAGMSDSTVIAQQLAAVAEGAPVAGMTGSASLGTDGASEAGCVALAFDRSVEAGLGIVERASAGLHEAARSASVAALDQIDPASSYRLLVILLDTCSGDQAEAVAGAYCAAGPTVPLTGGATGGADAAQFAGGHVYRDSVVAVAIGSEHPIGVGIAHGCARWALPAIVTRSHARLLQELDGRLAETVYLEKLGIGSGALSDAEFEAAAACHPLAQPELSGEVRLRHVLGRTPEGSLRCATSLPENSAVEFAVQQPEWIVRSAYDAVSSALAPLGDRPVRASLVFDCAGRKRALGDSLSQEVTALLGSFGHSVPPLAGLYTHGEIGRVRGAKGDRNHAIVVVAFA